MNTAESNKLIADFMGMNFAEDNPVLGFYRKSWDWLMPVVEKIQHIDNLGDVHVNFQIEMMGAVELWIDYKRIFARTAFEEGTLINAVYEGVIEFIKWFNEHKV